MNKEYLGDSVYVQNNAASQIILTTENGLPSDPSNTIVLEMETLASFLAWCERHGWIAPRK